MTAVKFFALLNPHVILDFDTSLQGFITSIWDEIIDLTHLQYMS